jgi:hypothetical protein
MFNEYVSVDSCIDWLMWSTETDNTVSWKLQIVYHYMLAANGTEHLGVMILALEGDWQWCVSSLSCEELMCIINRKKKKILPKYIWSRPIKTVGEPKLDLCLFELMVQSKVQHVDRTEPEVQFLVLLFQLRTWLRQSTSALVGDPDPYPWVFQIQNAIPGSVRVSATGWLGAVSQKLAGSRVLVGPQVLGSTYKYSVY